MTHRLTALAMAIALSGSPALLAACTALCVADPAAAQSTGHAHAGHHGQSPSAVAAPVTAHVHHDTTAAAAAAAPAPADASDGRLVARCVSCCPDGPNTVRATAGVEGTVATALSAAPRGEVVSFDLSAAARVLVLPPPPVPPPAPTRAPLVLRI